MRRVGKAEIITPDALFFFDGKPHELALYEKLAGRLLAAYPQTAIRVQKTQISFDDGRMSACVSLAPVRRRAERPARFITVTFSLEAPLEDPRALPVRIREDRWTHHVIVGREDEIDDSLMGWIDRSHALSAERK